MICALLVRIPWFLLSLLFLNGSGDLPWSQIFLGHVQPSQPLTARPFSVFLVAHWYLVAAWVDSPFDDVTQLLRNVASA